MHCSEAGIHLNKSADTLIHNNALSATQGIELLRASTDAMIVNNLLDGSIRAREGATYTATNNVVGSALYFDAAGGDLRLGNGRSGEHTSELQSLMRISYAVFCLKKKNIQTTDHYRTKPKIHNPQILQSTHKPITGLSINTK